MRSVAVSRTRGRLLLVVLAGLAASGCNKDAPKEEDVPTAETAESAAPAAEATAPAEAAAAGAGERTMERARVSRSRETVRSDAPKTKAVGGN